jgi:peptidoglycan/xylan/chitin deacetylase (PgdA/CDA1 family)
VHQAVVATGGLDGHALPPYTISLTYDDGPDAHTLELAEYLHSQGIRATFFVNGCRLSGAPIPIPQSGNCAGTPQVPASWLNTIAGYGHRVANHTEDHADLLDLVPNTATIISQLQLAQARVDPLVADGFFLMRPPYGDWNAGVATAVRSAPTLDKLTGPILWDIDGGDWACFRDNNPVEDCGQLYLDSINARPDHNGVVLMHDREEFNVGSTNPLLLTMWLLDHLPRSQYTFVPLDAIPDLPGTRTAGPASLWSLHFSNPEGWADSVSLYGTLRFGDINGDGKTDVCGRAASGIYCALSNGSAFVSFGTWMSADYTDALGWAPEPYSTTIQLGDINGDGKADLCGRSGTGMLCALSTGTSFLTPTPWSSAGDFSDQNGWGTDVGYYGSLRLADVNGDGRADVCGRGAAGMYCALSDGARFRPKTAWKTDDFSNAAGWLPPQYSTTIQLADLNGDGRADVCGRGVSGLVCALSTGSGFGPMVQTPDMFGDADHWPSAAARYRSIRLADVDGDGKADVCGRNATGIVCAFSVGDGSFQTYHYLDNAEYRDDLGWSESEFGVTMGLADIDSDGRADLCGRGYAGLICARSP